MRELTRVVVAEDQALLREGLSGLLGRFDFCVVASVGTAAGLLEVVADHKPDLLLTDIRMPPDHRIDGLQAALAARASRPTLAVVVLSGYVRAEYALDLLESGDGTGVGYLLKDRVADVTQFADTLRKVVAGHTVIDPEIVKRMLQHPRDPLDVLTGREREVLAHVAEGQSNAAIGARLHVTEGAVAKHIGSVLAKLGLPPDDRAHRRVQAVLTYLSSVSPAGIDLTASDTPPFGARAPRVMTTRPSRFIRR